MVLLLFVLHLLRRLLLLHALDVHLGRKGVLGVSDFVVDVVVVGLLELVQKKEGQVEPERLVPHYHVLDLFPLRLQRTVLLPLLQPAVQLVIARCLSRLKQAQIVWSGIFAELRDPLGLVLLENELGIKSVLLVHVGRVFEQEVGVDVDVVWISAQFLVGMHFAVVSLAVG